jgi:quercetin dioxygenase-like cupin family protein
MTNRRVLLGAIGAAIAASAQAEGNHAETVHRQPLPPPFEGWEAEFASVTMVPGPGYAPHHHPGFVLGYVIDGAFRFAIDGQPERVLHAGEAFYEPPGAHHTVSASADPNRSTRILAIIISERKEKKNNE